MNLLSLNLMTWMHLKADDRGVTALEYGLTPGIIVAIILVGFRVLAKSLSTKFVGIGASL